jgi:hypothetical protein
VSINRWIDNTVCEYTQTHMCNRMSFSLRKEGNLVYAIMWMRQEDIVILSGISQTQTDIRFHLCVEYKTLELMEAE